MFSFEFVFVYGGFRFSISYSSNLIEVKLGISDRFLVFQKKKKREKLDEHYYGSLLRGWGWEVNFYKIRIFSLPSLFCLFKFWNNIGKFAAFVSLLPVSFKVLPVFLNFFLLFFRYVCKRKKFPLPSEVCDWGDSKCCKSVSIDDVLIKYLPLVLVQQSSLGSALGKRRSLVRPGRQICKPCTYGVCLAVGENDRAIYLRFWSIRYCCTLGRRLQTEEKEKFNLVSHRQVKYVEMAQYCLISRKRASFS